MGAGTSQGIQTSDSPTVNSVIRRHSDKLYSAHLPLKWGWTHWSKAGLEGFTIVIAKNLEIIYA